MPAGGWGAGRRLACLLLVALALCGHARRTEQPDPGGVEEPLAEVLLERDGRVLSRGSGIVVAGREENGERACYLVTVGHVVSPATGGTDLLVGVVAGGVVRHRVPGRLLRRIDAGDRDLAVVRVSGLACRPARIGSGSEPVADVWLAGFPSRGIAHVWPGHLREPRQPGAPRWVVDGGVTEGASGGGVFDAVIPLTQVRRLLREWGLEDLLGD